MELSVITVRHPSCMHGKVHCASVLIFSSAYIRQHDLQNLWLHRILNISLGGGSSQQIPQTKRRVPLCLGLWLIGLIEDGSPTDWRTVSDDSMNRSISLSISQRKCRSRIEVISGWTNA